MSSLRRFFLRLTLLFRSGPAESELDREIAAHLAVIEDEYRANGMSEADARLAARRALGSVAQTQELHRDARSFRWINDLRQDVRFALRSLRRESGFTAVVILTLALGIGANTAIFSVVHSVLLRSLPYPDADRFVRIALQFEPDDGSGTKTFAAPVNFQALTVLRTRSRTMTNLGTYAADTTTLSGRGEAARLSGLRISPPVMSMLSTTPLMGRLLEPREEERGLDRVVVVSHSMWQRRLGSDETIVGKAIVLNGAPYTVVGVTRPGFHFPDANTEYWVPYVWSTGAQPVIVGRVVKTASFDAASSEVTDLLRLARQERGTLTAGAPPAPMPAPPGAPMPPPPPPPGGGASAAGAPRAPGPPPGANGPTAPQDGPRNPGPTPIRNVVLSLQGELVATARTPLLLLSGAVGFVLLIACVNVGGLLLARGSRREREIWVRLALGAGRWRIARQLLTESLLLTLMGGAAGVWMATAGVAWLRASGAALPRQDLATSSIVPRLDEVNVDSTVLLFALAVSIVAAVACGLVPALRQSRAQGDGAFARHAGASGAGLSLFRRSRGRAGLVVVQISLAIVLLVGSGLLIRSFLKLSSVEPGYQTTQVLTFQLALPPGQSALALSPELVARIRALPGVRDVGLAAQLPMTRSSLGRTLLSTQPTPSSFMPPPPPPPGVAARPNFPSVNIVSQTFLSTLGIALLEGRGFTDAEPVNPPRSLLINRTLAESGLLGEHPVGKRVYTGDAVPWDVIGVVEDVRASGLAEPPGPQVFASLEQVAAENMPLGNSSPYFAVRTDGSPIVVLPAIRAIVRDLAPAAVPDRIATMDELLSNSLLQPRFYTAMFGLFATIAGLLAVVGIHEGIALAITRRTREIGLRIALGASRAQVLRTVLGETAVLAAAGIACGVVGGVALTRFMAQMLFDLTPLDPAVFLVVPLAFTALVAGAAFLSARPALALAPMDALRRE